MFFKPSRVCIALALLLSYAEAASSTGGSPTATALAEVPTLPAPTASPLPPVSPFVGDLIGKLATAIYYSFLLANGGDYQAICDAIEPKNLSGLGNGDVNGTVIKKQVCTGASFVAANAALGPFLIEGNQRGSTYLATALYAVQVAGNFAGGPDLAKLCTEIEAELINGLFTNYTDTDVGSQIKDYVCGAAASSSRSASACPTAIPTRNSTHHHPKLHVPYWLRDIARRMIPR